MSTSSAPAVPAVAPEFAIIPTKNRRGLQVALVVDQRPGEIRLRRYIPRAPGQFPEFERGAVWTPLSMIVGRPESDDPRVVEAIALLTAPNPTPKPTTP